MIRVEAVCDCGVTYPEGQWAGRRLTKQDREDIAGADNPLDFGEIKTGGGWGCHHCGNPILMLQAEIDWEQQDED